MQYLWNNPAATLAMSAAYKGVYDEVMQARGRPANIDSWVDRI